MNLEIKCVSQVNAIVYHDGIPLVRKAIMRHGLPLNANGFWEIKKLFKHLRDMMQLCQMEFPGNSVQETKSKSL